MIWYLYNLTAIINEMSHLKVATSSATKSEDYCKSSTKRLFESVFRIVSIFLMIVRPLVTWNKLIR